MNRYDRMFEDLRGRDEIAFIPFVTLGFPSLEASADIALALVDAGADALELGVPFSDPVADGPVIQRASARAIEADATPESCWASIASLRERGVEVPIGVLTYANVAFSAGLDKFYVAAASGADSVLLADVPAMEAAPFALAAQRAGVCPVLMAPQDTDDGRLRRIAELGGGYTYVQTRTGVTGEGRILELDHSRILKKIREFGAPPPVMGFGISNPAHVAQARAAGAAGAISGSAVVRIVEEHAARPSEAMREVSKFTEAMKEASR